MLEATESYSVSGFLQEEFTRESAKTADSVIDNFRDVYYGRELAWSPPARPRRSRRRGRGRGRGRQQGQGGDDRLRRRHRRDGRRQTDLSRSELATIVDNVAETVEDDTGKTFGGTVRENAVDAAWQAISGAGDDDGAGDEDGRRRERRSERVVTRRRRLRLSRRRHLDPEGRRRGAGDGRSARAPVREPRRRRVPDHSRRPRTPSRTRTPFVRSSPSSTT